MSRPGRTVLMTGASGFVGSAIGAGVVLSGASAIRSVAPDDPDGQKARAAIASALQGFGADPEGAAIVEPVALDLADPQAIEALDVSGVDEVWHVAAAMSYSFEKFTETVEFNVNASARLMRRMPAGTAFFHISTTGVAGPGDDAPEAREIPEDLLTEVEPLNPYVLSKHMAEFVLAEIARQNGVGLTIIRPGSVIGHSRTGWSNGTRFGYYSYLQAFKRYLGRNSEIDVDIRPDRRFPVIHIDHLVDLCRSLALRPRSAEVEVFHACNQALPTVAEHFARFEAFVDNRLKIGFGEGETTANRGFNRMNADNNRFMGTRHVFANHRLRQAIGEENVPPPVTGESLDAVFRWYLEAA